LTLKNFFYIIKKIKKSKEKIMGYCLVTGGAGFIGSHVVDELIKLKKEVIVLDDLSGGYKANVNKAAKFIKGSITNTQLIKRIFSEYKIDYVYHLAAYAAEILSSHIKLFNYNNNLIGSINLINCAVNHNIKCFVFTSSIAVFGHLKPPFSEDTKPVPADSYGIAKLAVEEELRITKELFGLNYIIFRPHNVFGERQNIADKYRNVIGIFMNQILQNKPLTVFGDGNQQRAFTYIKNISDIITQSAFNKKCYNEIFNIGDDEVLTVNEIAKMVSDLFNWKLKIKYYPPRKEAKFAYCTHTKIKKYFNYTKKYTILEGLKNMAEWVKKWGARKSKEFKNIELERNLPSLWRKK